ncbi:hypothetical protein PF005_g141 [Phytophthora fragariae]|uniref:TIP41-like protein n=1 Tax=Phytophthora fragariae TaxID=53985 RepID=A0A6A4AMD7_9STRA|nr:hypothetical protein PF010_g135 [Phytophthora fragariae]KAE9141526.1 hypothetical protein PF007_g140 [Phytophthora fragariae]KAE9238576.1 hypothetical protein PF005_g141 [Phytophthora fragariae]KAE9256280.1 hypothetical protein PF004_g188 [Phytophthora fragariae]KAE9258363.1 hypothetical protein PF002_g136 [Phytophthora fragariae]
MSSSSTAVGHGGAPPATESAREVSGWRFSCHRASAMSSVQRNKLAEELRLRPAIPLPEVVFGESTLDIEHPDSGLALHFDAKEALHGWMRDHVGVADRWEPSSWISMCRNENRYAVGVILRFWLLGSTSYSGSIYHKGHSLRITPNVTSETLPLDKLKHQVSILFYERVLLFEDDIRDLGEIYVEIRVRVMEFGWLLLCRYYCRIDEKTVKLQDTRYYHEFGDDFVWRDHELRESTTAEIKQILSARHPEQQTAPFDLSGDVVHGLLRPTSTKTEKIHFVRSS